METCNTLSTILMFLSFVFFYGGTGLLLYALCRLMADESRRPL